MRRLSLQVPDATRSSRCGIHRRQRGQQAQTLCRQLRRWRVSNGVQGIQTKLRAAPSSSTSTYTCGTSSARTFHTTLLISTEMSLLDFFGAAIQITQTLNTISCQALRTRHSCFVPSRGADTDPSTRHRQSRLDGTTAATLALRVVRVRGVTRAPGSWAPPNPCRFVALLRQTPPSAQGQSQSGRLCVLPCRHSMAILPHWHPLSRPVLQYLAPLWTPAMCLCGLPQNTAFTAHRLTNFANTMRILLVKQCSIRLHRRGCLCVCSCGHSTQRTATLSPTQASHHLPQAQRDLSHALKAKQMAMATTLSIILATSRAVPEHVMPVGAPAMRMRG
eukprot:Opistho-2@53668